jgi:hypothetical protein
MTPLSPVDVAVAFEPLIVKVVALEDTIVSKIGVTDGVMMPLVPVERMVELAPEIVRVVAVEETIVSTVRELLTLTFNDARELGGMTPSVPVEKNVEKSSTTVTLP